ncbi:hypothetical protein LMOSLCC2482_1339 [Listeria monocytogenes serotype 7 str. SLCC2482]|nr:hypothetical protein LMOSLCC2482_1339 [Listeria monocytogenes serotype 7 str. SLCC2482]
MRPIDKMCTKMVEKAKFSIFLGIFLFTSPDFMRFLFGI